MNGYTGVGNKKKCSHATLFSMHSKSSSSRYDVNRSLTCSFSHIPESHNHVPFRKNTKLIHLKAAQIPLGVHLLQSSVYYGMSSALVLRIWNRHGSLRKIGTFFTDIDESAMFILE